MLAPASGFPLSASRTTPSISPACSGTCPTPNEGARRSKHEAVTRCRPIIAMERAIRVVIGTLPGPPRTTPVSAYACDRAAPMRARRSRRCRAIREVGVTRAAARSRVRRWAELEVLRLQPGASERARRGSVWLPDVTCQWRGRGGRRAQVPQRPSMLSGALGRRGDRGALHTRHCPGTRREPGTTVCRRVPRPRPRAQWTHQAATVRAALPQRVEVLYESIAASKYVPANSYKVWRPARGMNECVATSRHTLHGTGRFVFRWHKASCAQSCVWSCSEE